MKLKKALSTLFFLLILIVPITKTSAASSIQLTFDKMPILDHDGVTFILTYPKAKYNVNYYATLYSYSTKKNLYLIQSSRTFVPGTTPYSISTGGELRTGKYKLTIKAYKQGSIKPIDTLVYNFNVEKKSF